MTVLKNKIQQHIKDTNLSIAAFEKKLEVPPNTIYHIATNKSKSPGIETVIKIADSLNCFLDSLCGRKEFLNNLIKSGYLDDIKLSTPLVTEASLFVLDFLKQNKAEITKISQLFFATKEICNYSINNKKSAIDPKFAEWLCKSILTKKPKLWVNKLDEHNTNKGPREL